MKKRTERTGTFKNNQRPRLQKGSVRVGSDTEKGMCSHRNVIGLSKMEKTAI